MDDATTETEIDKHETRDYWRKWVKAAKKAAEKHWTVAKEAWAEYSAESELDSNHKIYPIYWSTCKTIESAFYARTPKVKSQREFGVEDEVALTATLITDRLAGALMKQTDFDDVMQLAVGDFLHADKATTQVLYSEELKNVQTRVALTLQPDNTYTDPAGMVWTEEVLQDELGTFGLLNDQVPVNKKIELAPAPFDEVLHTPDAKIESEIESKAFYFCLNKERAKERFGDKLKGFTNWKKIKGEEEEDKRDRDREEYGEEYLEGWEIYCKTTERVYWFSEQYTEGLLDAQDDPWQLEGFFPAPPFIIASRPRKTLYPAPAYKHLKSLVEQLHAQYGKVFDLVDGIRRRALVNGDEELVAALNSEDNVYVIARNLQNIVEKGGLENMILWIPVQELVTAITELNALEEKFKNDFYEFRRVPDILRGTNQQTETATGLELEASAANDSFRYEKQLVARLARDSIELMVDLALAKFDDNEIAEMTGFEFMTEEDKQRFPLALQMLRRDDARIVRVEIDTDSLSFLDEQLRARQVAQASQTVTAGLREVAAMSESSPEYAQAGLQTVLQSLEAMPTGRSFQDAVKKAVNALLEKASQPPPEPPPDYEQMKIQLEQSKQEMASQATQAELQLKAREVALKEQQAVVDAQLEQIKEGFNQQLESMLAQLEQQRVQIEMFKAQVQANESQMEEIRLARETDLKSYQEAIKTAQALPPTEPQPPQIINVQPPSMPPITIVNEAAKPGKKMLTIQRDELGQMKTVEQIEEPLTPALPIIGG